LSELTDQLASLFKKTNDVVDSISSKELNVQNILEILATQTHGQALN
jgi:hypothetical protein